MRINYYFILKSLFLGHDYLAWVLPPPNSFIVWMGVHGKLPTYEKLKWRRCLVVSVCVLCMASKENTSHLFLHCNFSNDHWVYLGVLFGISFECSIFIYVFERCVWSSSTQVWELFMQAITNPFHTIQMDRNVIWFKNYVVSLHAAKIKIHMALVISAKATIHLVLIHISQFFTKLLSLIVDWMLRKLQWLCGKLHWFIG